MDRRALPHPKSITLFQMTIRFNVIFHAVRQFIDTEVVSIMTMCVSRITLFTVNQKVLT